MFRHVYSWLVITFVVLVILGMLFATKLLFVAGLVLIAIIAFGTDRGVIRQYRDNAGRGIFLAIVESIPLSLVLILACIFAYLIFRELLRTTH